MYIQYKTRIIDVANTRHRNFSFTNFQPNEVLEFIPIGCLFAILICRFLYNRNVKFKMWALEMYVCVCVSEIWCPVLTEERTLRVSENRMLRKAVGHKWEEEIDSRLHKTV